MFAAHGIDVRADKLVMPNFACFQTVRPVLYDARLVNQIIADIDVIDFSTLQHPLQQQQQQQYCHTQQQQQDNRNPPLFSTAQKSDSSKVSSSSTVVNNNPPSSGSCLYDTRCP
jgi:hypothetical protein